MKKPFLFGALSLAGLCFLSRPERVQADDYLGAAAVLQKISDPKPAGTNSGQPSEALQFRREVESFNKQSRLLKPEAAAQQWLNLLDRQFNLSPRDQIADPDLDESRSGDIWGALPAPPAWDALRKAVEARPPAKGAKAPRELGLRLLVHTLVADRAAQSNDVVEMEALMARANESESYSLARVLDLINNQMLENSEDPGVMMKSLERRLVRSRSERSSLDFSVPNLVPLVGAEKAEAFLRRALLTPNLVVEIREGEETKALARKLALELADQLKTAQWNLACSLDAGPLYEALEKHFPLAPATDPDSAAESFESRVHRLSGREDSRQLALSYYLLGMIAQNRSREAVALAQKLGQNGKVFVPADALRQLERAGYTRATHDFLRELLLQNPDLPVWNDYIALAARIGETGPMLELARQAAAREDLSEKQRQAIRQNLFRALLAAGEADEGIAEIKRILAGPEVKDQSDYESISHGELALTLARVGQLLGRKELAEDGIRLARESISRGRTSAEQFQNERLTIELANFLGDTGRGPQAESLLMEALTASKPPAADSADATDLAQLASGWRESGQDYLAALARIYNRAGRHADVLLLLDQSPQWGITDLAQLRNRYVDFVHQHEDSIADSVRYCAAAALVELNRREEALKIVNAILDENGGYDPAYELLLRIGGAAVSARLDALFVRDQFEERPLIWKAAVLKQAGRLEEAEATARRAIAIDPSDGEQGRGRRMRVYAVLADIREARGDKKEADLLRGAVDAIRLSENADRYYEAGLLKQAVAMYRESLTHFADAYCIQSRLALRLSELGLHAEAEEHYRRAYELMPDSFGRVESHCFGCERAFDGEKAQGIAEKVFTSLVKSTPQKPQVHYLLGYLREEQGRYGEAVVCFREAVRRDPDYLNAWKHLQSVGEEYPLKAADKDAVVFTILRLDPLCRHGEGGRNFRKVTDLRKLWSAVEVAAQFELRPPESLYPLAASKARFDKLAKEAKVPSERIHEAIYHSLMDQDEPLQPARAVLQNGINAAVLPLLGGKSSPYGFGGID